jgi:hypothetical protein
MLNEEQYLERTPDLVAKVRKMREAADKAMNLFTHISDYDVRRVVGHGPKHSPVPSETVSSSPASDRLKKSAAKSTPVQASIEFTPAPKESGDDGELA